MRKHFFSLFPTPVVLAASALFGALFAGMAGAQDLDLQPLINARSVTSLLEVEGKVIGGLDEGGLVIWERTDPDNFIRLLAGEDISGNQVTDLAWSGRNVWVATFDGGLTRIGDLGGDPVFRQFSSNLGAPDLTAVTGAIIGGSEWVYYAMDGAGIGRIVDGLPGYLYTAEQDGLINNNVTALQFYRGELFVGTPTGISRFANNEFTDQNAGLNSIYIRDLCVDVNGDLLAAGNGGVYRWNQVSESWTNIGGTGTWVHRVVSGPAGTFALGVASGGINYMSRYDGLNWTSVPLPYPRAYSVHSGQDLWVGGRIVEDGMNGAVGYGWLGKMIAGGSFDTWRLEASLVRNANGVTFGADGTPWIGSHNADAVSQLTDSGWNNIYEIASADNDSSGLFNHYSNVLAMTTGTDGIVYAGQYTWGAVRIDPAAGRSELMFPAVCGLRGGRIQNMITHPDGTILFLHGAEDAVPVEVLADPAHWRNQENWLALTADQGDLPSGEIVHDALVERPDVIWFALETTGLVRWDINGDFLGPDDPLTWLDTSDDRWDTPLTFSSTPGSEVALALAPDGSIWAGGNGVVRFTYNEFARLPSVLEQFDAKDSPFDEGLITGNVNDLAVDGAGTLWVATPAGLNRGITTLNQVTNEPETAFAAWFDLGNFLANSAYGLLYLPDSIVSLPGGVYQRLAVSPDGKQLLLSSDRGAVLLDPGPIGGFSGDLSGAYVYPNPFLPEGGANSLKLGGIDTSASREGATVSIYNQEGQLVYSRTGVKSGADFWWGANRTSDAVSSGMYLVRIQFNNTTVVRPLAVIR